MGWDFTLLIVKQPAIINVVLRLRLKEILKKKKKSNYRLWVDLGINQGQLSCFFNRKKGISLKNLERIARYVGYEIIPVSKEEIRREQHNKKKVDVKEAAKIAEREIEGSVEKFESMCPGFYVDAIDGPPVKLRWHEGKIGVVSTKGRDEPDLKQKQEKRPKYRPFSWHRDPT